MYKACTLCTLHLSIDVRAYTIHKKIEQNHVKQIYIYIYITVRIYGVHYMYTYIKVHTGLQMYVRGLYMHPQKNTLQTCMLWLPLHS